MKKFILSAAAFALVAVTGITLAPTTASAIPAFARQTGAACFSCHFQEVPALKPFGRAFKMNSFTDMGDQALVEDDNMSLPVVLNASFVVRGDMTHTSGGGSPSTTAYNIPVDQNLLISGRAGSNTGVFIEFGGGAGDTGGGINNIQVMNSFDAGGFKVGIGYADSGFGGDAILNVNSVYGQHAGQIAGLGSDISAVQNSGFTNSITAIGAWVGNDMGFVQFALIAPGGSAGWAPAGTGMSVTAPDANNNPIGISLKLAKLVKVAATLDIGGFDTIIGVGSVTGRVGKQTLNKGATAVAAAISPSMDLQFVYGQMQGELGDMSLGIYGDWAHAKGKTNGNLLGAQDTANTIATATNIFNGWNALNANEKFDAFSVRATLEPISRLVLGAGYGYRKTTDSVTAANGNKHQTYALGMAYSVYQNMILSLKYTSDKTTTPGAAGTNTKTTVVDYVIYL